jgi:hypothetical protein
MGLTVQLSPTLIRLHWLTDEQLENLAGMNSLTAISLAFLGICVGAWISFHTALETGNFKDEIGKAKFELYQSASILLSLFFGVIFLVALILSARRFWRARKTEAITPQQSQPETAPQPQSPESTTHEN